MKKHHSLFLLFVLAAFLFTPSLEAATWLHIIDDPWAGFNGNLTYAITSEHARPVMGDLDNDGNNDLVVGSYDDTLMIYWNNGDGTYREDMVTLADFDVGFFAVPVIADLNNDGWNDLVVGNFDGELSLFLGNVTHTFTESTALDSVDVTSSAVPFAADMSGDGVPDILVGNSNGTVKLFVNNGTGTLFTENTTLLSLINVGFDSVPVVTDFTCDDFLNVVVGSADGSLYLYVQTTPETFENEGAISADSIQIDVGNYSMPFAADLNDDGFDDLLVGSSDGAVSIYTNNCDGMLSLDTTHLGTLELGAYSAPAADDLDGDDAPDIVAGAYDGTLSVFWNDGTGDFDDGTSAYGGIDAGDFSIPTSGDLDGDGSMDILVGSNDGTLTLYVSFSPGVYLYDATRFSSVTVSGTSVPVITDLNHDTRSDVIVGSADGTITYLQQNADHTFSNLGLLTASGSEIAVGSNAYPVATDIDEDGDTDLVVGSYANKIYLFTNDGSGTFVTSTALSSMRFDYGQIPTVGDFNGDGRKDVLVGTEDGHVSWVKQNADGTFTDQGYLFADGLEINVGETASPFLFDMNSDGLLDLLVANAEGKLFLFTQNVGGSLSAETDTFSRIDVGDHAAIFVTDINNDGYSDILLGSLSGRVFLLTTDYDTDSYVGLLDCDNFDPSVYTGAPEVCDGQDNDCDELVDEEDTTGTHRWYPDADEDDYGDPESYVVSCSSVSSSVSNASDCDDTNASIHPGVTELCTDSVDNDCDDLVNEGCVGSSDIDDDGDGLTENEGDCDDTNDAIFTGASESCNSVDDDCDLSVDEDAVDAFTYYHDGDSDGYGDPLDSVLSCPSTMSTPSMVSRAGDCNDAEATINPSATELCTDTADNNCNGTVNEDCTTGDTSDSSDMPDQSDPSDSSDSSDQSDPSDPTDTSDDGVDQGESGTNDPAGIPQGDPATAPTHVNDYGMPSACALNVNDSPTAHAYSFSLVPFFIGLIWLRIRKLSPLNNLSSPSSQYPPDTASPAM